MINYLNTGFFRSHRLIHKMYGGRKHIIKKISLIFYMELTFEIYFFSFLFVRLVSSIDILFMYLLKINNKIIEL